MPKKNFYITTSIAYTNDKPHIGFALELLQADVVARYQRLKGKDVWFLTGTDEHGLKIFKKASQQNQAPQSFCDQLSKKFRELTEKLDITNDDFIRTTDKKRHWPAVYKLWKTLEKKGDIYKKEYQGLYCLDCESFLKKSDLVDNQCPFHKTGPELVKEENYFFKLSKYLPRIKQKIKKDEIKIVPAAKKKETLSLIGQRLEDVSFSRVKDKVKWGISLPHDPAQLIYVWGDALTNYLSTVAYASDDEKFRQYWPADIHFIGKDILKFHALLWPAMLLSAGLPLFKTLFVHGFITVDGQKMSKSLGNIVDPFVLIEKYGSDALRYFLLREIPSSEDGDFSLEKFEERYQADLAKGLGNLAARIIKLAKICGLDQAVKPKTTDQNIEREIKKVRQACFQAVEEFKFHEALAELWQLIGFADKYIEQHKPWQKSEKQKEIVADLLYLLKEIAGPLGIFLPASSKKIIRQTVSFDTEPLFPSLAIDKDKEIC